MKVTQDKNRGRVETIKLSHPIIFNGNSIKKAKIEIDHINYGLGKDFKLNKKARTNFTIKDIEKFILMLDGESIIPSDYKGKVSKFELRIDCPVKGKFYGKQFIMIFDTHYDKQDEIHTITLFPGW